MLDADARSADLDDHVPALRWDAGLRHQFDEARGLRAAKLARPPAQG